MNNLLLSISSISSTDLLIAFKTTQIFILKRHAYCMGYKRVRVRWEHFLGLVEFDILRHILRYVYMYMYL